MIIDNYQLVALSSTASYRVTKHGSFKTTLFGGEALVMEIIGPGTVYIQTKNVMEFARALLPFFQKETSFMICNPYLLSKLDLFS